MFVVSGHGPLATSGDCSAEEYWPALSKWILQNKKDRVVVMCMDANSTVAETDYAIVGDVISRKSTPSTPHFLKCLADNCIWLPATFSQFARYGAECLSTSFGKAACIEKETGKRVDHIGVSGNCSVTQGSANAWPSFVLPHKARDPTVLLSKPAMKPFTDHFRRRRARYDRNGTKDPAKREHFCQLVDNIPRPHYRVEPSSHAWLVDIAIENAAIEAFGEPTAKRPRQSYVTPETMKVIGERRDALSGAHFAGKILKQNMLKVTFKTWAANKRPWRFHSVFGYNRPWVLKLRGCKRSEREKIAW